MWNTLKNIATNIVSSIENSAAEIKSLEAKYELEDDEYLARQVLNGSTNEKGVAYSVLRKRLGDQGAKEMLQEYHQN